MDAIVGQHLKRRISRISIADEMNDNESQTSSTVVPTNLSETASEKSFQHEFNSGEGSDTTTYVADESSTTGDEKQEDIITGEGSPRLSKSIPMPDVDGPPIFNAVALERRITALLENDEDIAGIFSRIATPRSSVSSPSSPSGLQLEEHIEELMQDGGNINWSDISTPRSRFGGSE